MCLPELACPFLALGSAVLKEGRPASWWTEAECQALHPIAWHRCPEIGQHPDELCPLEWKIPMDATVLMTELSGRPHLLTTAGAGGGPVLSFPSGSSNFIVHNDAITQTFCRAFDISCRGLSFGVLGDQRTLPLLGGLTLGNTRGHWGLSWAI